MDQIVLDTSVIIKWFSEEEGHEKALKILDKIAAVELALFEPELMFYELINALWFGKKLDAKRIGKILAEFVNLEPSIVLINAGLTAEVLKLISKFPITAYDAAFIALANLEKIPLVTADSKHHRKEYSEYIVPLAKFQ